MSCYNKFACSSVGRISKKQRKGIRPTNSGDPAFTAVDELETDFDNLFSPFTKQYQKYFDNPSRPSGNPTTCCPVADRGTGVKKHKNTTNTINQFEALDQKFEDKFNPMTDIYQKVNTINKNYNTQGVPIAKQGTGALNACTKTRRKGQRQLDNNNVASDFCTKELSFDRMFTKF